ncbi:hypothetical protein LJR066_003557 [Acidovorax sp. LjRoot66]|uniref:hypothetical protein n=1 Tax=Acidovorax sp. LjRoot66 TaxID=3342334 RepID=UPI003ECFBC46
MTTQTPPARTSHGPAGEFPQPVSPWESRGLLYAEVATALVVLAMVLANSMDPGFWQSKGAQVQANAAPDTTLATAGSPDSSE